MEQAVESLVAVCDADEGDSMSPNPITSTAGEIRALCKP
jgi:hypothetical protein